MLVPEFMEATIAAVCVVWLQFNSGRTTRSKTAV